MCFDIIHFPVHWRIGNHRTKFISRTHLSSAVHGLQDLEHQQGGANSSTYPTLNPHQFSSPGSRNPPISLGDKKKNPISRNIIVWSIKIIVGSHLRNINLIKYLTDIVSATCTGS